MHQNLTLSLPERLYAQIKRRADRRRHSVEDETVELLATAVPTEESLPPDLAAAVEELALVDDQTLWQAARSRWSADSAAELESLHFKKQRDGLTPQEQAEADVLLRQYERTMLVRARAAQLLRERGHDVSVLLATP